MCGIIFATSKKGKPIAQHIVNLYTTQANRGRQGYGYLTINKGKLTGVHRALDEVGIKKLLEKEKADTILFHHRLPTSTKNTIGTTHPIFVSNKELKHDYYWGHNGVITNSRVLKNFHNQLGYVYNTEMKEKTVVEYIDGRTETIETKESVFNDSESLAIELSRYLENLSSHVDAFGGMAVWGVSLEKGTNNVVEIFYGKNKGRDLKRFNTNKLFGVSSETGHDVKDMKLFSYEVKGNHINPQLYERELSIDEAEVKPVVVSKWDNHSRMGYHRGDDDRDYSRPDKEEASSVLGYNSLQNAYYTLSQCVKSSTPFNEFFETKLGNGIFYVPNKYQGINVDNRPMFEEAKIEEVLNDRKGENRLDELATKYVKIERASEKYDEMITAGTVSYDVYKKACDHIGRQIQAIEEEMYNLGIEEEEVEEVIDTARQLRDYNESFEQLKLEEVTGLS